MKTEENKNVLLATDDSSEMKESKKIADNSLLNKNPNITYYDDESFVAALIEAINNKTLLIFAGAGLSKLCGAPLWKELANKLLDECAKNDRFDFDYHRKEILLSRVTDERELVSIAQNIMSEVPLGDDIFFRIMRETLRPDEAHSKNMEIIRRILPKLSRHIITTNADHILDEPSGSSVVLYKEDDIRNYRIGYGRDVIHIHGSIDDRDSMVFTTESYLRRYAGDVFKNNVKEWLSHPRYTVLFIGYGFSEMQLLDFLVNGDRKNDKKIYFLNCYYDEEDYVFKAEADYYAAYGVKLIAYSKNKDEYRGLIKVLEFIEDKVANSLVAMPGKTRYINDLLGLEPSEKSLIGLKRNYPSWSKQEKDYFIDTLRDSEHALLWVRAIISKQDLCSLIFDNSLKTRKFSDSTLWHIIDLLATVDAYDEETAPFYLKFLQKTINKLIPNSGWLTERGAPDSLLKLLFSHESFVQLENAVEVLKECIFNVSGNGFDSWLRCSSYKNDVLSKLPIDESLKFLDIFFEISQSYWFDDVPLYLFFKAYGDYFNSIRPRYVIDKILLGLKGSTNDSYLVTVFEDVLTERGDGCSLVFRKWLASAIRSLDGETAKDVYHSLLDGGTPIELKSAIYVVNTHFSILRDEFFRDIDRFRGPESAGELYSLFSRNAVLLTAEEIESIFRFALSLDHRSFAQAKLFALDLLKFVSALCPDNRSYVNETATLFASLGDFDKLDLKNYPHPFDRGKKIPGKMPDLELHKKKWLSESDGLTLDEFLGFFNEFSTLEETGYQQHNAEFLFKELSARFKLYENIEAILKGRVNKFRSLIDLMEKQILSLGMSKEDAMLNILKLEGLRRSDCISPTGLSSLFALSCAGEGIDVATRKQGHDFLRKHGYEITSARTYSWSNALDLRTSSIYQAYFALINLCVIEDSNQLIAILNRGLKEEPLFVKSAISASFAALWHYQRQWTSTHLKKVFRNVRTGYNYSFGSFASRPFFEVSFIEELSKQGILASLLNSPQSKDIARPLARFAVTNYMAGTLNKNVIEDVAKTKLYADALLDFLLRNTDPQAPIYSDSNRFADMVSIFAESKVSALDNHPSPAPGHPISS